MKDLFCADDGLLEQALVEIHRLIFFFPNLLLTLIGSVWFSAAIPTHHADKGWAYARAHIQIMTPYGLAKPPGCTFSGRVSEASPPPPEPAGFEPVILFGIKSFTK